MRSHYDQFDYPSYWKSRMYEQEAEVIAIKEFLNKIKKIKNLADIGSGYGRLLESYIFRTQKAYLVDPSQKLLTLAKKLH